MLRKIILIALIAIVVVIAIFSYCACVVSSRCNKYEGYHRRSDEYDSKNNV
jgi:hypothetical protein